MNCCIGLLSVLLSPGPLGEEPGLAASAQQVQRQREGFLGGHARPGTSPGQPRRHAGPYSHVFPSLGAIFRPSQPTWVRPVWPSAYRLSQIPLSISRTGGGLVLGAVDGRTPCGRARLRGILLPLVTVNGLRAREGAGP